MSLTLILIYNFFLIIVFCFPLITGLIGYAEYKKKDYLLISAFFLTHIIDNLIISLTEVVPSFSEFYDSVFMNVPSFKTVIYFSTFLCYIKIAESFLKKTFSSYVYILFAITMLFLLFIPMLPNGAFKVWSYYFPTQVFLFILSLIFLKELKGQISVLPEKKYKIYRLLTYTIGTFSILIALEDAVVILNYDQYNALFTNIFNRNFCEDVLYIILTFFATRFLINGITTEISTSKTDVKSEEILPEQQPEPSASDTATKPAAESDLEHELELTDSSHTDSLPVYSADVSKFFLFCQEYQLTAREQDILKYLLENKNNTEISESLFISMGTVKAHVHNIFTKLEVSKRQQLIEKYRQF